MGQAITQKQADEYLREDLQECEKALNECNVNFQAFDVHGSTGLVRSRNDDVVHTNGRSDVAVTDLVRWYHAGGKPLLGLKRRRIAEAEYVSDLYYLDKEYLKR